jgi:hypothetical protein
MARPAEPRGIPEDVVWTLTKGHRRAEGRMRLVPIGDGQPAPMRTDKQCKLELTRNLRQQTILERAINVRANTRTV